MIIYIRTRQAKTESHLILLSVCDYMCYFKEIRFEIQIILRLFAKEELPNSYCNLGRFEIVPI